MFLVISVLASTHLVIQHNYQGSHSAKGIHLAIGELLPHGTYQFMAILWLFWSLFDLWSLFGICQLIMALK